MSSWRIQKTRQKDWLQEIKQIVNNKTGRNKIKYNNYQQKFMNKDNNKKWTLKFYTWKLNKQTYTHLPKTLI